MMNSVKLFLTSALFTISLLPKINHDTHIVSALGNRDINVELKSPFSKHHLIEHHQEIKIDGLNQLTTLTIDR